MAKVFTITNGLENMGALRSGGQGSVYKGRRIGEIITAVKLLPTPIHAEDENDKNFRDFQNEVDKLRKVNEDPNPHVVKILNSGITESGSLPFIEMEFVEGPDLEELLKLPHDKIFSIREVIKVADQLSNALAHCHKVGVKHGDIKSNNVKLNRHSGNYMLLDFGLAVMSDEQRRTSLRHAGAIEFMAPEQNNGVMLFETDVYSFGVILFELLAGTVPFPLQDNGETSRNAVMISHMETPVPDVLELRRKNMPANWPEEVKVREMRVPKWLLTVLSRCLEKRPENRFKNGIELHEAVVLYSTSPVDNYAASNEQLLLASENERLKALVEDYQRRLDRQSVFAAPAKTEPRKSSGWFSTGVSGGLQPVVIGLLILFTCLGLFAGFTMLNGRYTADPIDTVALNAEKQRLRDSIVALEKLNAKRYQDSIDNARRFAAIQEQIAMEEAAERERLWKEEKVDKKKKKGFLGIRFGKREE